MIVQLPHYLGLLHRAEENLAGAFREVAHAHRAEPDVELLCKRLSEQCNQHAIALQPIVARYSEIAEDEPDRLHTTLFTGTRTGPLSLLRDLHDLYLMTSECDITWTLVGQAAQGARDDELVEVVQRCETETTIQLAWLCTRLKVAAPQALIVAGNSSR